MKRAVKLPNLKTDAESIGLTFAIADIYIVVLCPVSYIQIIILQVGV